MRKKNGSREKEAWRLTANEECQETADVMIFVLTGAIVVYVIVMVVLRYFNP